jgi:hypothetical protein
MVPSCKKEKERDSIIYGSGNIVEEGKDFSDFDRIEFSGMGTLIIHQEARHPFVLMKVDDNLQPYMNAEVKGRTLIISSPSEKHVTIMPTNTIEYHVMVKELNKVSLAGNGSIVATNGINASYIILNATGTGNITFDINVKELEANLSGSATLLLSGKADRQKVQLTGDANYNGMKLDTIKSEVRISGSGNSIVKVTDELEVDISGNGSVDYIGSPKTNIRISGNGKVNKRDK